ncbi:GDSL esterase/lipase At5g45670-like [Syzygium oleosum]|uniref:GDSL esterase/lipase At5g45670-like n=1 Tax=Syzygium oleosum TaxID=219896 RepID=UPI0024BB577A|nr:GDSL esterase/lipase At5g45670-like [Syzygium oleosum]
MAAFRYNTAWRVILSVLFLISSDLRSGVLGARQVPCYFIFGDSLSDNGNNNDLKTQAKANYPPYGIDFPEGVTGRFTNGRTTVDIPSVPKHLGFDKYIQPFATAKGCEILVGVNYASGGVGIRDETGQQLGDRISFNHQLQNHLVTISRVGEMLGSNASAYLNKCMYTVGMGSNDYINNYFMPNIYTTSELYMPEQYADVLIEQYRQQLKTLYSHGARKVVIFGLSVIGCAPAIISTFGTNGSLCVDKINSAVLLFNNRLKPLVDELNCNLADAKFTYIDFFGISMAGLPALRLVSSACCKVRDDMCIPFETPCRIRLLHAFYDGFHPTEMVNLMFGARAYKALLQSDSYPFDIHHLAML